MISMRGQLLLALHLLIWAVFSDKTELELASRWKLYYHGNSLTNHFGQHIQHVRKFESIIQNIIMKTMMMARGTNALFGLIKHHQVNRCRSPQHFITLCRISDELVWGITWFTKFSSAGLLIHHLRSFSFFPTIDIDSYVTQCSSDEHNAMHYCALNWI